MEICLLVDELVSLDLILEADVGESMRAKIELLKCVAQGTPRRSTRLTPGRKGKGEIWEVPPSQTVGENDHIFQKSPDSPGEASKHDEDEESDSETGSRRSSVRDSVDGIQRNSSDMRRKHDDVDDMLASLAAAERVNQLVQGVSAGCSKDIKDEMNRAVVMLQTSNQKLYETTKANNMELKKALSNFFNEMKQANRRLDIIDQNTKAARAEAKQSDSRLDSIEQNAKEAARLARVNHEKLNELARKRKLSETDPISRGTTRDLGERYFCSFCDSKTHDTARCRNKVPCFRCGDSDHKQNVCFWTDRSCNRCKIKGHKVEMHETRNVTIRGDLVRNFPGKFLHFLTDAADGQGPAGQGPSGTRGDQYWGGNKRGFNGR